MTSRWVGDYEIVKRLSVGGMATLYLARRHGAAGFSRLVALKIIHPHLVAQSTFIDMFVDEARICSQISHPNVVHVEEFGEIDGIHYLVMEYIDGCSVAELLRLFRREGRKLEPELVARIVMQIAGGLHAAHETLDQEGQPLDIVHRDISPSNILLSADGNAKLIDFGIAKARNRVSETEAGVALKGKYKYIAPEQATRSTVDRRSDIFSLGVVFWEMLVGKPLFADDTHVALFNRLHHTDVAAPSTINPDALVILDSIVLSMLQHDPDDRPQTATEVKRRITLALPSAANREASEIGALAIEVRDKRAARRANDTSLENDTSLSPTSRSSRGSRPDEYHIEIEPAPRAQAAPTMPTAPPPWSRRAVQIGILSLLGIGVTVGVLVGRSGGLGDAPVSPIEPPPAIATDPAASQSSPNAGAAQPIPAPAIQPPVSPTTQQAAIPSDNPTSEIVSPETPAAPGTSETTPNDKTAETDPTQPGDASDAKDKGTHPARRDAQRGGKRPQPTAAPKKQLTRDTLVETEVQKPAPAPRATAVRKGDTPFAEASFDDNDNGVAPNTPSRTKVKKTPIVTDFGN